MYHAGHGGARDLSEGRRHLRHAGRSQDRSRRQRPPRQPDGIRRRNLDRLNREDVEVEAQYRRSRRHHRDLWRRRCALVHAVGFAARPRRDLERRAGAGRLALRAAAVAAGERIRPTSPRPRRRRGRLRSAPRRWRCARRRTGRSTRSPPASRSCISMSASPISGNSPMRWARRWRARGSHRRIWLRIFPGRSARPRSSLFNCSRR